MSRLLRPLLCGLAVALCALLGAPRPASAWVPLTGDRPVWPGPVRWSINQAGSAHLSMSNVERILETSYDTWENPSCSDFRHIYQGTTSRSATNHGDDFNVHGFLSSWPGSYGNVNATIGITITYFGGDTIYEADVNYNQQGFTFVDGGGGTDLQSIATHEYGHSLGLDHTPIESATMFAAYTGGTGARTLHSDDQDGVCALYPAAAGDDDDDDDDDDDSDGGDCVVCEPCAAAAQCPPDNLCLDFFGDGSGLCTQYCENDGSCPGDSECWRVPTDSGDIFLCLNPTADVELCPPGWECEPATGDDDDDDDDDDDSGDDDDDDDDDNSLGGSRRRGCRCDHREAPAGPLGSGLMGLLLAISAAFLRRREGQG